MAADEWSEMAGRSYFMAGFKWHKVAAGFLGNRDHGLKKKWKGLRTCPQHACGRSIESVADLLL